MKPRYPCVHNKARFAVKPDGRYFIYCAQCYLPYHTIDEAEIVDVIECVDAYNKLQHALRTKYADSEISIEITPTLWVVGHISSNEFRGITQQDRQKQLWSELEKHLSESEQRKITVILTMTPEEIQEKRLRQIQNYNQKRSANQLNNHLTYEIQSASVNQNTNKNQKP